MQNERNQISCLKQSSKISKFCLKQSQVLRLRRHTSTETALEYPPPLPPRGGGTAARYPYIDYTMQLDTGKIS